MAWMATTHMMRQGRSWSGRERNVAFLNTGAGRMANISTVTGFDLPDDGRGLAKVDWDHDGDLDLIVSNRGAPRLRLFRNDAPGAGRYVAVRLQGTKSNRDAIGARVVIEIGGDRPRVLTQTLRAGEGFLSQSSKWLHFGLGADGEIVGLSVRWPSGEVQQFGNIAANRRYRIVEGQADAEDVTAARAVDLAAGVPQVPPPAAGSRVVVVAPQLMPRLPYVEFGGIEKVLAPPHRGPVLVNLWASWCRPCLEELAQFTTAREKLLAAGLEVVALSVDGLGEEKAGKPRTVIERLEFPFTAGEASSATVDKLEAFQRTLLDIKRPLPLPSSFLLDPSGRVAVMYTGKVEVETLLADVAALGATPVENRRRAIPFSGIWRSGPRPAGPMGLALMFYEGGMPEHAIEYAEDYLRLAAENGLRGESVRPAAMHFFVGTLREGMKDPEAAMRSYQSAVAADPRFRDAHRNMGRLSLGGGNPEAAVGHFQRALALDGSDALTRYQLAGALGALGRDRESVAEYQQVLRQQPGFVPAANNLAWALATHPDPDIQNGAEAVRWATVVAEATRFGEPKALDTLAAAYARAGSFEQAVAMAEKSIALAKAAGQTDAATGTAGRLALYREGKAFMEARP